MGKPLKVLIVEKSNADANLLVKMLRNGGYQLEFRMVDNVESFISALKEGNWDLVLSGNSMTGFSGRSPLKVFKTFNIDIPFILISGAMSEEVAIEAMKTGAHDYVMKNNLNKLLPVIERELKGLETRRQNREIAEALCQSEDTFAKLFRTSTDGFSISKSATGEFIDINEGFERIFGYSREEIIGRSSTELNVWLSHEERDSFVTPLLKNRVVRDKEVRFGTKSGKILTALISAEILQVSGEECVLAFIKDITERKKTEDEIENTLNRLNTLVEAIPDIVFLKDVHSRVQIINKAYELAVGSVRGHIIGKRDDEILPAQLAEESMNSDREIVRTGNKYHAEQSTETAYGIRYYDTIKVPLKNEIGTVTGIVGIMRDITDRKSAEQKYRSALEGTIQTMAKIVELRDPYTAGHQNRASRLAVEMASEMGLEQERIEGVRVASLLYEIGKINVPSEILNKPGRITAMEYELIQSHPQSAYEILKNIDFPWPVADTVHQHHERIDGSGFPNGLKGEEILLEARILAVADVVEAMCSHRQYRASLGIDKALGEIESKAGSLYDEDVVSVCLTLFREKGFTFEQ